MAAERVNYTGCKIILRDSATGEPVGTTYVISYSRDRDMIRVPTFGLEPVVMTGRYSALIFTPSGVDECFCSPRGTFNNNMEYAFALFKHDIVDKRNFVRYDVNMDAMVHSIAAGGDPSDMSRVQFEVKVLNMSASGILFKAPKRTMQIGDVCNMLTEEPQPLNITCKIVRTQNMDFMKEEFGARLLTVRSRRKSN